MNVRYTISRRALVRSGLGAIAAPAILRALPAEAQSQVIKIGHVSPKTGPLAGFGEADGFILDQVRAILAKGLENGGKTYKVEIISKDSQSNGNRAAEVASELILGDKVNLIVASATGIRFIIKSVQAKKYRTEKHFRGLFGYSIAYLFILFTAMVIDDFITRLQL